MSTSFNSKRKFYLIRKIIPVLLVFSMILQECLPVAMASEFTIFKKTYVRNTEKPVTETDSFIALSANKPYMIKAINGLPDSSNRVSSVVGLLNGSQILSPNQFNQNIEQVNVSVMLQSNNQISMELRSKPQSRLTLEIIGNDDLPPVLTWFMPENNALFETQPIASELKLSDDNSGIDPSTLNILLDNVSVRDSFTPLGAPTLDVTLNSNLNASHGPHTLTAQVKDIAGNPAQASVSFLVNRKPTANAGADQNVFLEDTVTLDGSASIDPDGDQLTYKWSLASKPDQSAAAINGTSAIHPTFVEDCPGTYIAQLIVNDGEADSAADMVTIITTAINRSPIATGVILQVYPSGIVSYWKFDEGNGSIVNDSVNANDGAIDGTAWTAGKVNSALTFNGNSKVAVPDNPALNPSKISVEVWVNLNRLAPIGYWDNQFIICKGDDRAQGSYYLSANRDQFHFYIGANGIDQVIAYTCAPSSIQTGCWYHVVGTYDGTSLKIYVNGVLQGTTLANIAIGNTGSLTFGYHNMSGWEYYVDGDLDEVAIYKRALTPEEIQQHYQNGLAGQGYETVMPAATTEAEIDKSSLVILDGSKSHDPDDDSITYQWSILSKPTDSQAIISNENIVNPSFVPDRAGIYKIQLIVSDGKLSSEPAIATITAKNQPPVAIPGSDQNILVGDTVTLNGSGSFDPEGDPLSYRWAFVSQPANSIAVLSNANTLNSSFIADMSGAYEVQLIVNDGEVDSAPHTVHINTTNVVPINHSPGITSMPPTTAGAGQLYQYQVSAIDPDVGDVLIFSLTQAPTNMTVDSATGLIKWTPTAAQVGNYDVTVRVQDGGGLFVTQPFTVVVTAAVINHPPIADAGKNLNLDIGTPVKLDGSASSDPDGDTLSYSWSIIGKPQDSSVVLTDAGTAKPSFTPDKPGTYQIQLIVNDGKVDSAPAGVIITAQVADLTNPVVEMGVVLPPSGIVNINDTVAIQVRATDNVGIASLVLTVNGASLLLNDNPQDPTVKEAQFASPTAGTFHAVAVARDAAGNTGSNSLDIFVTDPNDTAPPEVDITAPAAYTELKGPTNIIGTAADQNLVSYTLEYSFQGENRYTTFAKGTSSIINGILGTLDATLLRNGSYEVRLTATDINGQESSISQVYEVMGDLKIGNFKFSEVDLTIPASGIPLSVVRSYDSLDKNRFKDFGYGWSLNYDINFKEGEESRENIPLDISDSQYDFNATNTLSVRTSGDRNVYITSPDGHCEQFNFVIRPARPSEPEFDSLQTVYIGAFEPQQGAHADLIIKGDRRINPGFYGIIKPFWEANPHTAGDLNIDIREFYDIPGYILRMQDGTEFTIDKTERQDTLSGERIIDVNNYPYDGINSVIMHTYYADPHLTSIHDRNGNTVSIAADGIFHSDGKSVLFNRDAEGRLISIVNPAGNTVVEYSYNAEGDLASVTRLVDAATNYKVTTTYQYTQNNGVSTHNILSITSPTGKTPVINEYDNAGRLIASVDAFGKRIEYTINTGTHQEIVKDRRGFQTVYAYNADGDITDLTDPLGDTTHYEYDANRNKISETIAVGTPLEFTRHYEYDTFGAVTRAYYTVDGQLIETATSYVDVNGAHLPSVIVDPIGTRTENNYDAHGNLHATVVKDSVGTILQSTTCEYDVKGRLTAAVDSFGTRTESDYDAGGNIIEKRIKDISGAILSKSTFSYDQNGNVLTQTRWKTVGGNLIPFATSSNTYDSMNRLLTVTDPLGYSSQTIYNNDGQVFRQIDKCGIITESQYDSLGQLLQTAYAVGLPEEARESYAYDENGNRATFVDRAGRIITYGYDPANHLVQINYPDGAALKSSYDQQGKFKSSTNLRGFSMNYDYDLSGRLTSSTNALNQVSRFAYNANGCQTARTDALGQTNTFMYDAQNRRTQAVFPDGTSAITTYDALGRCIAETDQAGITTRFSYDALGQLVAVTDALGQVTRYAYDEIGNMISQIDANNHTTAFEYDQLGRCIKRTLPLGMLEIMNYDANGNVTKKTDFNGYTTEYNYDALNRLIKKSPDPRCGEPDVSFTYMLTGRRASMSDSSGITTYQYDSRDRLLEKATPEGTLTYAYDANGNVVSINSSNSNGTSVAYNWDQLNRLSAVHGVYSGTTTYGYDNVGNLQNYAYPNGVQTSYAYNALNRLTSMSINSASGTLARYAYTLGPTGNRISVTELNGRLVSYAYDNLYRLTNETISGDPMSTNNGSISYVYDPVGNRLSRSSTVDLVPSTLSTYDANDRLTSDTYDNNGNILASDGKAFAYDFENRLISMNNNEATFVYDGDGNRVARSVNGVTTQYLVDDRNLTGYAQVLEEIESGQVKRVYTYGTDLISQSQIIGSGWQTNYYGYDGHGNVRLLTDANGAVTDTYDYEAFGMEIAKTGTTLNDYKYCGEQYDTNIRSYYLRARYYNPPFGRFWTSDLYDGLRYDPSSLHKYTYTAQDPVNQIDPSGQSILIEILVVILINPDFWDAVFGGIRIAWVNWFSKLLIEPGEKLKEIAYKAFLSNNEHIAQCAFEWYAEGVKMECLGLKYAKGSIEVINNVNDIVDLGASLASMTRAMTSASQEAPRINALLEDREYINTITNDMPVYNRGLRVQIDIYRHDWNTNLANAIDNLYQSWTDFFIALSNMYYIAVAPEPPT